MIVLKSFQDDAVTRGVASFSYLRGLLEQAGEDATSRATAVACHGYILIEAPTGAGKTLIAGSLAERFSGVEKVVWFWFAPFGGLVEQTRLSLRERFAALQVRELRNDRTVETARSGDVFVTTWATVAVANKEGRKVRQAGEEQPSADEFIPALRAAGFRIGVVVDEAHHGFKKSTQAVAFVKQVLRPDYTVLVTATPNDKDIRVFLDEMHAKEDSLFKIGISRVDAVASGLVKKGLRAIAYLAAEENRGLVDYEKTALEEGVRIHREVERLLKQQGINLKPLMLVQVDSHTKTSVERAKEELKALGIPEAAIAVHTADEPDANLMALANDERREALIFKMAVALGFDAPRAFTLVSMRGSQDTDFGVQVAGRILRVHRRLQGKKGLPDALNYGYAVFADSASQTGMLSAAEKINRFRTGIQEVAPSAVWVTVGETQMVQILQNGQAALIPGPKDQVTPEDFDQIGAAGENFAPSEIGDSVRQLQIPGLQMATPGDSAAKTAAVNMGAAATAPAVTRLSVMACRYPLKPGMPAAFKTAELPEVMDELVHDLPAMINFDRNLLLAGQRENVQITRVDVEAFTHAMSKQMVMATLSAEDVRKRAQGLLFRLDYLDPREIRAALMERLRQEYEKAGISQVANHPARLRNAFDLILAYCPELIQDTAKQCLAKHIVVRNAEPLPLAFDADVELRPSEKNIYGVYPSGMNSWETAFAELLDQDLNGRVKWWHRNPSKASWSVKVILSSGKGFYPDFVVGLNNRGLGDGVLLVETKFHFEDELGMEKVNSEHKVYRRPLILTYEEERRWMSVRYDAARHKNVLDRVFDLAWAGGFV